MTGTHLIDNFYQWDNDLKNLMCNLSKFDEVVLWHKRLGHISLSKICKILKAEVVQRVPLLKQSIDIQCSECLTKEQVKAFTNLEINVIQIRCWNFFIWI